MNNNYLQNIDVKTLAELLKCDPRTIQLWVQNEGAPRTERGEYPLLKFLLWRINKLSSDLEIAQSSGDEKLHALKVDTQKIILAERKAKYKKMLGELVELETVRIYWRSEISYFKKAMNALKTKLLNSLEGITEKTDQMVIITREVNQALNAIAEEPAFETGIDKEEILNTENDEDIE
jgi:hypothetical protein